MSINLIEGDIVEIVDIDATDMSAELPLERFKKQIIGKRLKVVSIDEKHRGGWIGGCFIWLNEDLGPFMKSKPCLFTAIKLKRIK